MQKAVEVYFLPAHKNIMIKIQPRELEIVYGKVEFMKMLLKTVNTFTDLYSDIKFNTSIKNGNLTSNLFKKQQ